MKALANLAQLTSLALALRADVLRRMVVHMAAEMHLADSWQYELAAMLSLIGCITLPAEAFEHAYRGESASPDELRMYRAHPEVGFHLLAGIPRLECVARMIQLQQGETVESIGDETVARGVSLLRIAQELDRRMLCGTSFQAASSQLRTAPGKHPVNMLNALRNYSPPRVQFGVKRLLAHQLVPGMVLEDDVTTRDGGLTVICKDATLTDTLIDRVRNFSTTRGVREPIQVRVPQNFPSGESQILLRA